MSATKVSQPVPPLQAQLGAWTELHHVLHEILTACAPFYASLRALGQAEAASSDERALLQAWRPCQAKVDRLADFESSAEYVRPVPRQEGTIPPWPDWGARIAALRREMEERLREEAWNTAGLMDLADEFQHACACYLTLAGRELRRMVEEMQPLDTHLPGGGG